MGRSLPSAYVPSEVIVTGNRVYLIGGNNGSADLNTVYTCTIDSDGNLSEWTQSGALATTLKNTHALVTSAYAYLVGGHANSVISTQVIKAPFNGGVNDYLALIASPSNTLSPNFRLPDLTSKASGIYEFYIRALP